MLWTPGGGGDVDVISNTGIVGTVNVGTGVPSNATTLLYGTVTELISAANNTQDSWGIEVWVWNTGVSAAASQATMDLLIGGATDDVLAKALIVGGGPYTASFTQYFFPVHIPRGVRIAAQLASVRTSITPRVLVYLYGGGVPPFRVGRKVVTYGTQINNTRGQAVTPAASGGAASVTQMTASTSEDHFFACPGFQVSTDTTTTARNINVGIGVGAATEERIGTWWYQTSGGEEMSGSFPTLQAFRRIPSGTRLTMLASNSGANDAAYDGLIYCV